MDKSIVAIMLQQYETFTKSEKKIIDYVLDHQKDTQSISITELSGACGVAVSTISVFCRKLKLAGFNDFKLELARATLMSGQAPGAAEEIQADDTLATVMEKVYNTTQDALSRAYHLLQENTVRQAAELLYNANQVVCLGQGNHSIVSTAAWAQFSTVSPKFKTMRDSHHQSIILATLSKSDAVLYFSFSGATHEVMEAAQLISARGAKLILVTRYPNSPASAYADAVLLCGPNEQPLQFGSIEAIISQLYVVDVLFTEFCRRNPAQTEQFREAVGKALAQKHL